jgi:HPt (histidine-containing phosphotransfer) domain-containing protein
MNETREERAAAAKTRLAELSAKFVERTHNELAVMRDRLARLAGGEAGALGDIHHFAHRIAGTGATLGFAALSDAAARIEALAEVQETGVVPGAPVLAQITGEIDALDGELARVRVS